MDVRFDLFFLRLPRGCEWKEGTGRELTIDINVVSSCTSLGTSWNCNTERSITQGRSASLLFGCHSFISLIDKPLERFIWHLLHALCVHAPFSQILANCCCPWCLPSILQYILAYTYINSSTYTSKDSKESKMYTRHCHIVFILMPYQPRSSNLKSGLLDIVCRNAGLAELAGLVWDPWHKTRCERPERSPLENVLWQPHWCFSLTFCMS